MVTWWWWLTRKREKGKRKKKKGAPRVCPVRSETHGKEGTEKKRERQRERERQKETGQCKPSVGYSRTQSLPLAHLRHEFLIARLPFSFFHNPVRPAFPV